MLLPNEELSPLGRIFADRREIEAALKAAVKDAIRLHKLHGVPMAISRGGKVVLVPAEELEAELRAEEPEKERSRKAAASTKRPTRQKRTS